jgi:hypothetical protein
MSSKAASSRHIGSRLANPSESTAEAEEGQRALTYSDKRTCCASVSCAALRRRREAFSRNEEEGVLLTCTIMCCVGEFTGGRLVVVESTGEPLLVIVLFWAL